VPGGIHHSVVVVGDLEASLRFYRDGLLVLLTPGSITRSA
jgi:catechol 2,3-dioxygenase-like lactoylglutathione lyase family enzyme